MKRRRRPAGRRLVDAGFGLLEAIVALTLLATVGAVMFDWIAHSIRQVDRIEQAERRARLQLDAQALLSSVDPIATPEGTLAQHGIAVTWRARAVRPPRPVMRVLPDGTTAPDRWAVGLFELQVRAVQPDPQDRSAAGLPPAEIDFSVLAVGRAEVGNR
jgi:type II secretory pathway pseudopilin PulG